MGRNDKDWGKIPTPDDVAQQMNSVIKLSLDTEEAEIALHGARQEYNRRMNLLENARNELGRMLKATPLLKGSDFRVAHRDEANERSIQALFGIVTVRE